MNTTFALVAEVLKEIEDEDIISDYEGLQAASFLIGSEIVIINPGSQMNCRICNLLFTVLRYSFLYCQI